MCGLTALITYQPTNARIIQEMNNSIQHRGPDDEGVVIFNRSAVKPHIYGTNDTPESVYKAHESYTPTQKLSADVNIESLSVTLAHRRLSILDLTSSGHQPMSSNNDKLWIIFNGEVYNHIELRAELINLGHQFKSHSDTEVILHAFQEWGVDSFKKLSGMFSFLIYDTTTKKLIGVRDRFGIKPLYYYISSTGIALGSEIKQFTTLPDWSPQSNDQRVYDFLNWSITDHTDETLFAGVYQLRAGQYFEIDLNGLKVLPPNSRLPVNTWYRLSPPDIKVSQKTAEQEFLNKLQNSLKIHLRADVPTGSCLSGGLDSSAVVCLIKDIMEKENINQALKTFSSCVRIKKLDESHFIKDVVNKTGAESHLIYPQPEELFKILDKLTWHQDEPFGSTSIFAQWLVFKLAAEQNIKVMLDGQGADEQLAGYHNFFGPYLASLFCQLRFLTFFRELQALKKHHKYSYLSSIMKMANVILPEPIRQFFRSKVGKAHSKPNWINFEKLNVVPVDPFLEIGHKSANLKQFSISQLTASNLQMLLHWEDRNSMSHSIESRVPYLNHDFVEFVVGLPDDYKINNGITKYILRKSMASTLPETITNRIDKLGFVTPEEFWLRDEATEHFRSALNEAIKNSNGIINENIRSIFEQMVRGEVPFSSLIWRIISFGAWIKQFNIRANNI